MSSLKVLVLGPCPSFKAAIAKLTALQSKQSFDLCFALDLFAGLTDESEELQELLDGRTKVPVQVYALPGAAVLPERIRKKAKAGEELAENLALLSKCGTVTLASGLKVASFGGVFDEEHFEDTATADPLDRSYFTSADVDSMISLLTPPISSSVIPKPVVHPDILLTTALPLSATRLATSPPAFASSLSASLDKIALAARSKYHFSAASGDGKFWERQPFSWPVVGGVCRLLTLGELGNKTKDKAIYAFSIVPQGPVTAPPANATACPFSLPPINPSAPASGNGRKRPAPANDGEEVNEYGVPNFIFQGHGRDGGDRKRGKPGPPPEHYTCKICEQKGHWIQDCPQKQDRPQGARRPPAAPISPDECWFCLANPKLTKHLIVSIGEEVYVTLPKGQLPDATKESQVPGGGHVLIIPIAHHPTLLSLPEEMKAPIDGEIEKFKKALEKCYAKHGAKMVTWEVGRQSGKAGHAHIQVCPVPDGLAESVEDVFLAEGKKVGIEFEEGNGEDVGADGNYFRVQLPDGRTLVHIIHPGTRFDLQFGRQTLATVLNAPERGDWKACARSDKEEKAECLAFKAAFADFAPQDE